MYGREFAVAQRVNTKHMALRGRESDKNWQAWRLVQKISHISALEI